MQRLCHAYVTLMSHLCPTYVQLMSNLCGKETETFSTNHQTNTHNHTQTRTHKQTNPCPIYVTLTRRLRNKICYLELFLDKSQRLQVVIGHRRERIKNHSVKWNHYGKEVQTFITNHQTNTHAHKHTHTQANKTSNLTHNQTNTQQINMHKQMQSINPAPVQTHTKNQTNTQTNTQTSRHTCSSESSGLMSCAVHVTLGIFGSTSHTRSRRTKKPSHHSSHA